jgi:hypothetical protein
MRVKTVKDHDNAYGMDQGIPYEKRNGRIYEIEVDAEAENLIAQGLVEKVSDESGSKSGGAGGSGKGAS